MSARIDIPDRDELSKIYDEMMSLSMTSDHFGVSRTTLRKWMSHYNIEIRSLEKVNKIKPRSDRINETALKYLSDREWLFNEYAIKQKTASEIGKVFGVSEAPVKRFIKKHKIRKMDHRRRDTKSIMLDDVVRSYQSGNTMSDIANEYNTTKGTISRWLQDTDVTIRDSNSYDRINQTLSKDAERIVSDIRSGDVAQSHTS
jgi:DNA invertase Pin-like site-specific DNA recombinase